MSSTATGTRSGWVLLPHKPIRVGAEALTILLWAACLVSRRGVADRWSQIVAVRFQAGDATLSGAALNFSSKSCVVEVGGLR
jgi:hypothetical protein